MSDQEDPVGGMMRDIMKLNTEKDELNDKVAFFEMRYHEADQKLADKQMLEIAYKRRLGEYEQQIRNMQLTIQQLQNDLERTHETATKKGKLRSGASSSVISQVIEDEGGVIIDQKPN